MRWMTWLTQCAKSPVKSKVSATPPAKVKRSAELSSELQPPTSTLKEVRIMLDKDVAKRGKEGVQDEKEHKVESDTNVNSKLDDSVTDDDFVVRPKGGWPRKRSRIVSDTEEECGNTDHNDSFVDQTSQVRSRKTSRSKSDITGSETDEYEDEHSEVPVISSPSEKESKSDNYICVNLVSGPIRDKRLHLTVKFQPLVKVRKLSKDAITKWTTPKEPCVKEESLETSEQTKSKEKDVSKPEEDVKDKFKLKDFKIVLDKENLSKVPQKGTPDKSKRY